MPTDTTLTLYVTEIGREASQSRDLNLSPRVDLADIRAWRFFHAAPYEFFLQYARGFWIDHVHVAFDAVDAALPLLASQKIPSLTLAGHFGAARLSALQNRCRQLGIRLTTHRLSAPRALTFTNRTFVWSAATDQALATAGLSISGESALLWTQWFNRFFSDEVLPVLRVRKADVFFGFMKALSEASFTGLNWAGLGARCGISGPCARDWCAFLTDAGVIELLPAATAPAPRRAKQRPKLCWNAPGLAVWLSDAVTGVTSDLRAALTHNAVYLALKDAFPEVRFAHFLDTNYVEAPLLLQKASDTAAVFFPTTTSDVDLCRRHHRSLLRAGIVSAPPILVTDNADFVFDDARRFGFQNSVAQMPVPR